MDEQSQVLICRKKPSEDTATASKTTLSKMAMSLPASSLQSTADVPPSALSPKSQTAHDVPSPGATFSPLLTSPRESPELRVTDSPEFTEINKCNGAIVFPSSPSTCTPASTSPRSSRLSFSPPTSSSKKSVTSFNLSKSAQVTSKPPSLFQPFLPTSNAFRQHQQQQLHHQLQQQQQLQLQQSFIQAVSNPIQQLQRQFLPFSIDNILRPNFGGQPNPLLDLAASLHQQQLIQHQQQQQLLQHQQQLLQQQQHPQVKSRSEPKLAKATSTPSKSRLKSEAKSPALTSESNNNQPVDLSSKSSSSSESDSNGSRDQSKDEDLPPGMVRGPNGQLWPAWVFCTRYSDRPSSGPRSRKMKKPIEEKEEERTPSESSAEKRPRTAFSSEQLARLKREFDDNRYLTEERRKSLSNELGLNENQIKIWFQNKRAKIKKSTGSKGELAQMLMAQGLYNHSTVSVDDDDNPIY